MAVNLSLIAQYAGQSKHKVVYLLLCQSRKQDKHAAVYLLSVQQAAWELKVAYIYMKTMATTSESIRYIIY